MQSNDVVLCIIILEINKWLSFTHYHKLHTLRQKIEVTLRGLPFSATTKIMGGHAKLGKFYFLTNKSEHNLAKNSFLPT